MRKFIALGALLSALASAQASVASTAVQVTFENLWWVGAKTMLPRVVAGQLVAPPDETCDLLGLTCTAEGDLLKVGEQKFPIYQLYAQKVRMVPLAPLVRAAGQTIVWNQAAKVATVSGGTGSLGWRAVRDKQNVVDYAYPVPLKVSQTAPKTGQPNVQLTLFSEALLDQLTLFSKWQGQLTTIGSLTPSSPDNPNKWAGCGGAKSCTLPVPRDALWVLAYLTAK